MKLTIKSLQKFENPIQCILTFTLSNPWFNQNLLNFDLSTVKPENNLSNWRKIAGSPFKLAMLKVNRKKLANNYSELMGLHRILLHAIYYSIGE